MDTAHPERRQSTEGNKSTTSQLQQLQQQRSSKAESRSKTFATEAKDSEMLKRGLNNPENACVDGNSASSTISVANAERCQLSGNLRNDDSSAINVSHALRKVSGVSSPLGISTLANVQLKSADSSYLGYSQEISTTSMSVNKHEALPDEVVRIQDLSIAPTQEMPGIASTMQSIISTDLQLSPRSLIPIPLNPKVIVDRTDLLQSLKSLVGCISSALTEGIESCVHPEGCIANLSRGMTKLCDFLRLPASRHSLRSISLRLPDIQEECLSLSRDQVSLWDKEEIGDLSTLTLQISSLLLQLASELSEAPLETWMSVVHLLPYRSTVILLNSLLESPWLPHIIKMAAARNCLNAFFTCSETTCQWMRYQPQGPLNQTKRKQFVKFGLQCARDIVGSDVNEGDDDKPRANAQRGNCLLHALEPILKLKYGLDPAKSAICLLTSLGQLEGDPEIMTYACYLLLAPSLSPLLRRLHSVSCPYGGTAHNNFVRMQLCEFLTHHLSWHTKHLLERGQLLMTPPSEDYCSAVELFISLISSIKGSKALTWLDAAVHPFKKKHTSRIAVALSLVQLLASGFAKADKKVSVETILGEGSTLPIDFYDESGTGDSIKIGGAKLNMEELACKELLGLRLKRLMRTCFDDLQKYQLQEVQRRQEQQQQGQDIREESNPMRVGEAGCEGEGLHEADSRDHSSETDLFPRRYLHKPWLTDATAAVARLASHLRSLNMQLTKFKATYGPGIDDNCHGSSGSSCDNNSDVMAKAKDSVSSSSGLPNRSRATLLVVSFGSFSVPMTKLEYRELKGLSSMLHSMLSRASPSEISVVLSVPGCSNEENAMVLNALVKEAHYSIDAKAVAAAAAVSAAEATAAATAAWDVLLEAAQTGNKIEPGIVPRYSTLLTPPLRPVADGAPYVGCLSPPPTPNTIKLLWRAADFFQLDNLKERCEDALMEELGSRITALGVKPCPPSYPEVMPEFDGAPVVDILSCILGLAATHQYSSERFKHLISEWLLVYLWPMLGNGQVVELLAAHREQIEPAFSVNIGDRVLSVFILSSMNQRSQDR